MASLVKKNPHLSNTRNWCVLEEWGWIEMGFSLHISVLSSDRTKLTKCHSN